MDFYVLSLFWKSTVYEVTISRLSNTTTTPFYKVGRLNPYLICVGPTKNQKQNQKRKQVWKQHDFLCKSVYFLHLKWFNSVSMWTHWWWVPFFILWQSRGLRGEYVGGLVVGSGRVFIGDNIEDCDIKTKRKKTRGICSIYI